MQRLTNLTPIYLDTFGDLLDAGSIYIGAANQDPELHPVSVYWDSALTKLATQPLRTLGGVVVNGENPANVYLADGDYSQRVRDINNVIVSAYTFNSASAVTGVTGGGGAAYQPLNGNLTNLAAIVNTTYGRNLLTLANQAALQAAVGASSGLQLTGGTVSGNIVRSGAGVHAYFANAAMTGGRIYGPDPVGTADATSQPGDIQLFY